MQSAPTRLWGRLTAKLELPRDWYLMLVAAGLGIVMGGVAAAFILTLHLTEQAAGYVARHYGALNIALVAVIPVAGALLAGLVMHYIRDESRSLGVSRVIFAIHRGRGRIPLQAAVRKWLASALTIGSGGSAGAEGPIVMIGASIGSSLGRLLKTSPQDTTTLLGCAAAAGIASVFNAPIAGIFFVMELLLRDFSLRTFTPVVIASVVSAAWTQTMLGSNQPLFGLAPGFLEGGSQFTIYEIPSFLLLGLLCGGLAPSFTRLFYWTESKFDTLPVHPAVRPATGAAVLGMLGMAYVVLAPTSFQAHGATPFYGNGYPVIVDLLNPAHYFIDGTQGQLRPIGPLLAFLVVITLLKAFGTCLTLGSGGAGGLFAPSLLMGAGIGGAFGVVAVSAHFLGASSPAHYALVGMAAMIAATTHAPLTGILLVYELTRSYEIVAPLMLAAVISAVTARLILRDSVYTWVLTRQGVQLGAMSDLTLLRRLSVRDVPITTPVLVRPQDSARRLLELSEENPAGDFVVVNDQQQYLGIITGPDLRAALLYREAIDLLQVSELLRSDVPTVGPDEPLDLVLEKFSRHDMQSLVVLGDRTGANVLGLITRSRLMQRYQSELMKD
jgi:CIC family chloride channel protein